MNLIPTYLFTCLITTFEWVVAVVAEDRINVFFGRLVIIEAGWSSNQQPASTGALHMLLQRYPQQQQSGSDNSNNVSILTIQVLCLSSP